MKILGIIPARGGSKGLPRKNIRLLAGRPLIEYTIRASQVASFLTKTVVSTEDAEIKSVAETLNCIVIDRPDDLARDDTPSLPVIQHAAKHAGGNFDAICLLQPTSPMRTAADIDHACKLLENTNADTVLSVCRIPIHFHPYWAFVEREPGKLVKAFSDGSFAHQRQGLPSAFFRNGAIYVVRWDTLFKGNTLYGEHIAPFEMSFDQSVNIDNELDWQRAELIFDSLGDGKV